MIRTYWRPVLTFAILYYLFLLLVGGVIFVFSHLPTRAINFDPVILKLAGLESALLWPWRSMLWGWSFFSESLPGFFRFLFKICNSLLWGIILVGFREFWRKIRT